MLIQISVCSVNLREVKAAFLLTPCVTYNWGVRCLIFYLIYAFYEYRIYSKTIKHCSRRLFENFVHNVSRVVRSDQFVSGSPRATGSSASIVVIVERSFEQHYYLRDLGSVQRVCVDAVVTEGKLLGLRPVLSPCNRYSAISLHEPANGRKSNAIWDKTAT